MELADRVVVLETGRIAQAAPPQEVYDRPSSRYVANFIGTANELHGVIELADGEKTVVETDFGRLTCAPVGLRRSRRAIASW